MRYLYVVNKDGQAKRKTMRNCDRVCNIQDAKGKYRTECRQSPQGGFWRGLCEWLMTPVPGQDDGEDGE